MEELLTCKKNTTINHHCQIAVGQHSEVEKKNEPETFSKYHSVFRARLKTYSKVYKDNLQGRGKSITGISSLKVSDENNRNLIFGIVNKPLRRLETYVKEIHKPEYLDIGYQRRKKVYSDSDKVWLEDETGRIEIRGEASKGLNVCSFVTGCPICCQGFVEKNGVFKVKDIIYLPISVKIPSSVASQNIKVPNLQNFNSKVILVPGLRATKKLLGTRAYASFLNKLESGQLEALQGTSTYAFLGGSYASFITHNPALYYNSLFTKDFESLKTDIDFSSKLIDKCLAQGSRQIIVSASLSDPVSSLLPQPPLPSILFEELSKTDNLYLAGNPGKVEINNKQVLFLDGIIVKDFAYQSDLSFVEIVKQIILLRNCAPSTPNSLECKTYTREDPLLINEVPDYVITSESEELLTSELVYEDAGQSKSCKIICLPNFQDSGKVYTLDFENSKISITDFS